MLRKKRGWLSSIFLLVGKSEDVHPRFLRMSADVHPQKGLATRMSILVAFTDQVSLRTTVLSENWIDS